MIRMNLHINFDVKSLCLSKIKDECTDKWSLNLFLFLVKNYKFYSLNSQILIDFCIQCAFSVSIRS